MTKLELIKALADVPDDTLVVLASDAEGNSHDEVYGVYTNCQFDLNSREVGLAALTPQLEDLGYGEEDVMTSGVPCVVIAP